MNTLEKLRELKVKAVHNKDYELGSVFRELEKMLMDEIGDIVIPKAKEEEKQTGWMYNDPLHGIRVDIS